MEVRQTCACLIVSHFNDYFVLLPVASAYRDLTHLFGLWTPLTACITFEPLQRNPVVLDVVPQVAVVGLGGEGRPEELQVVVAVVLEVKPTHVRLVYST